MFQPVQTFKPRGQLHMTLGSKFGATKTKKRCSKSNFTNTFWCFKYQNCCLKINLKHHEIYFLMAKSSLNSKMQHNFTIFKTLFEIDPGLGVLCKIQNSMFPNLLNVPEHLMVKFLGNPSYLILSKKMRI